MNSGDAKQQEATLDKTRYFWYFDIGDFRRSIPHQRASHQILFEGEDLGQRQAWNSADRPGARPPLQLAKNIFGLGAAFYATGALCVHEALRRDLEIRTTSRFLEVEFTHPYNLPFSVLHPDATDVEFFGPPDEPSDVTVTRLAERFRCSWPGERYFEIIPPRLRDIKDDYADETSEAHVRFEERNNPARRTVIPLCERMVSEHGLIFDTSGWVCSDRVYQILGPTLQRPAFWSWRYPFPVSDA